MILLTSIFSPSMPEAAVQVSDEQTMQSPSTPCLGIPGYCSAAWQPCLQIAFAQNPVMHACMNTAP